VHLALTVAETQKIGERYQQVFGFRDAETRKTRDHLSRHMTDGAIDFKSITFPKANHKHVPLKRRLCGVNNCVDPF